MPTQQTKMEKIVEEMLNDPELKKAFDDPVIFSRAVLGINPRWYQVQMLRNDSKRKIARMGRRTGKTYTMILHMLWYAFTHPDSNQLVIGPLGIQVDTIFKELRKIIKNTPILEDSMIRSVKSPQTIKFGNGAEILGLSAGSSSGGSATNIRGQGADWIYMDETDYLNESDINSVIGASLEDVDNSRLWCASTPTGARELFYEWCINSGVKFEVKSQEEHKPVKNVRNHDESNDWVQFHYPSWVNPNWDEEMEAELRALFTSQGYVHEVEAKFGDETEGVFNKEAIEKSTENYTYDEMRAREAKDTVKILGVDWDKYGAATQIVVSEFDEDKQKIKIIERVEIPQTEFTFDDAVNKIQELHNFWETDYIYLDRGYGEYQVETLKKEIGADTVKGVAFNQKIEVVDPTDKTVDKKMVKYFMVNQTSILLERGQFILPANDGVFLKQMFNYRVVKKTSSGKPVYTSEDEHALDAFMLTVLGFNQEFPELAKLLEKQRYASIIGKVKDKKLNNNEDNIFNGKFKKTGQLNDSPEMKGEPDYIKHLAAIKRANGWSDKNLKKNVRGGNASSMWGRSRGRSSWGSGGRRSSRSSPGRSTF